METSDFFKEAKAKFNKGLPLVVYRMPNSSIIQMYIQNSDNLFEHDQEYDSGFVFAPFHTDHPEVIFPLTKCDYFQCTKQVDNFSSIKKDSNEDDTFFDIEEKKLHMALVQKAKNQISNGLADKIVVARQEKIRIKEFDLSNFFLNIEQKYSNAFVYLWFHPQIGMWAGATPERLFQLQEQSFRTMALAGTQVWNEDADNRWTLKERKEQQFVTNYIQDALIDVVEIEKVSKPYTVKAGNLAHLRTDFEGKIKDEYQVRTLISSLHPTPATCGLPKNISKQFILDNEKFDRAYYTGFLGIMNVNSETNLFVNLRCVQLKQKELILYIGGGITLESEPENEWEETRAKAETMKKVID